MKYWEYKVEVTYETSVDDLNKMGNDGWELVQCDWTGTSYRFFWKREKPFILKKKK